MVKVDVIFIEHGPCLFTCSYKSSTNVDRNGDSKKIIMLTNFSETGPPISDAEILAIELLANGNFPSEFRNLYLSVNGGYLDDADGGNSLLLSGFVPIKYGRVPMEHSLQ